VQKILNRSKYKGIISLDFEQQEWRICSYIKVKRKKEQGEQLRYWGYRAELVRKGISMEEPQLSVKVCWLLSSQIPVPDLHRYKQLLINFHFWIHYKPGELRRVPFKLTLQIRNHVCPILTSSFSSLLFLMFL